MVAGTSNTFWEGFAPAALKPEMTSTASLELPGRR